MRIESVTAHAFGPLADETLAFAPGMTIIVGDNESAKTSWHAAIYSALCGRARRKGRATVEEQWFVDRHRPWDHRSWGVSGILHLDDGRRIEMRHDLAGNVDCSATDLQRARPVSDEIMENGAPDAAVWLGLDRRSFVATACIQQAQVLEVLDAAEGMQTILQRATATAGKDATAAEALRRLDLFQRAQVGRDDARSTRAPLRVAVLGLQRATGELAQARGDHAEYLRAVEEVDGLRTAAANARHDLSLYEAAAAKRMADDLRSSCQEVGALRSKLGDTPPPAETQVDALGAQVARALEAWTNRADPAVLSGSTSAELRHQLSVLPEEPTGDLAIAPEVRSARDALWQTQQALAAHDQVRPSTPEGALPPVSQDELLTLAHTLERGVDSSSGTGDANVKDLQDVIARLEAGGRRSRAFMIVGALLVVIGATLAVAGSPALGALAVVGVALLIAGALTRTSGALKDAQARHSKVAIAVAGAQSAAAQAAQDRQAAAARCTELGLAAVPSELRALATEMARHETFGERSRQWSERRLGLVSQATEAATGLREVLTARGIVVGSDPEASYDEYATACESRAALATKAARRADLEEQLRQRVRAEEMADERLRSADAAADQVQAAVRACGLTAASPHEGVNQLELWEERRRAELEAIDDQRGDWTRLETLLGGRTYSQLDDAASAAAADAERRGAGLDLEQVASLSEGDPVRSLGDLRQRHSEAVEHYRYEAGALAEREKTLRNVAEAEEAEDTAIEQLEWLKELDAVIDRTRAFLEEAQERVQRDLAPVLAATLKEWLPAITGGRYNDAIIDIETLRVQVCGRERRWRDAQLLSQGTAEQIYLLLRAALARHLTAGKESCPLLLDDVTVQSDETRTAAILELLHRLSADQQIIVFAQERFVGDWACTNLVEGRDAMIHLPVVNTS
jgi:hypothetical protein